MKSMKRKDIEKLLINKGFIILRNTGHTIWGNGSKRISIPHTNEVSPGVMREINKTLKEE